MTAIGMNQSEFYEVRDEVREDDLRLTVLVRDTRRLKFSAGKIRCCGLVKVKIHLICEYFPRIDVERRYANAKGDFNAPRKVRSRTKYQLQGNRRSCRMFLLCEIIA